MTSPWLTGKRDATNNQVVGLRHRSPDSLDWRTWEIRRIRRANPEGLHGQGELSIADRAGQIIGKTVSRHHQPAGKGYCG
jgi:hypothetical protein